LPLVAASAGFVYRYDPESDTFERETALPGQLYLETAEPVGRGRWNVGVSYQHVRFDTLDGHDLGSLSDVGTPIRLHVTTRAGRFDLPLTIPLLDLALDTHQVTTSVTYGATDDLDVNVTIPVLSSEFETHARADLRGFPSELSPPCVGRTCSQSASHVGIGDVFLRAKYRVARQPWGQVAAGLVLRLPAGSEDDLQGAGATEVAPMLYLMSRDWPLTPSVTVTGYLNAGMTLDATDVSRSEGRWGTGLDVDLAGRATFGLALSGRHLLERVGPAGAFDVPRCGPSKGAACPKDGRSALFGIQNERPDFIDLSSGIRVNVWRDVLIAFAGVVVAVNDDGLRADLVPLVGMEGSF
jgi:hypothetical protein